jgi:hypothetical protein
VLLIITDLQFKDCLCEQHVISEKARCCNIAILTLAPLNLQQLRGITKFLLPCCPRSQGKYEYFLSFITTIKTSLHSQGAPLITSSLTAHINNQNEMVHFFTFS